VTNNRNQEFEALATNTADHAFEHQCTCQPA